MVVVSPSKYSREYEVGRTRAIEGLIGKPAGAPALDLGCGPGHFSKILRGLGWEVTAVDNDAENVRRAQGVQDDALSFLSRDGTPRFGLALALELIEHMPAEAGAELLSGIRRVLLPGGRLILSTPNRHSMEGLGGYYWGERLRGWGKWQAWDETHVCLYTSGGIMRAMRRAGFDIESVTGYWYRGLVPVLGERALPCAAVQRGWPLNRLGFNVIVAGVRPAAS